MFNDKTSVLYQTRYCAQEDFSIALCMNESLKLLEHPLSINSYDKSEQIGLSARERYESKVIAYGSNFYLISDIYENHVFEKYSESSKGITNLPSMLDERFDFCFCSFMQKIYVIGGYLQTETSSINSCMCYDIKSNKWTYIASLKTCRDSASCAVFECKIVVTGGSCKNKKKKTFWIKFFRIILLL